MNDEASGSASARPYVRTVARSALTGILQVMLGLLSLLIPISYFVFEVTEDIVVSGVLLALVFMLFPPIALLLIVVKTSARRRVALLRAT